MSDTLDSYQPRFLGMSFYLKNGSEAMITDENACEVFIESEHYNGWMNKPIFYRDIGKDKHGRLTLFRYLRKKKK